MILDFMLGDSPLILVTLTAFAVVACAIAYAVRLGRRRDQRHR
ncbi:hypothetical protein [Lysobacter claricitrinus]